MKTREKVSGAAPASGSAARLEHLRSRSEAIFGRYRGLKTGLTLAETKRLMEELEECQLEIERENDELKNSYARLEESRDRYFEFYELAPLGYLVLDRDGRVKQANMSICRLLGLDHGRIAGGDLCRLLPGEPGTRLADCLRTVAAERGVRSCELTLKKGAARLHVLLEAVAVRDADDAVDSVQIAAVDISERKRSEEEIAALNESLRGRAAELESANRELESFSYTMAHDLRAPLRPINGFSKLLLDEYGSRLDEGGRRYLTLIRENTVKMGQFIENLLALFRINRLRPAFVPVNMTRIAQEVRENLEPEKDGRRVEIEIAALPTVEADEAMIRQALANLLSNALRFTRKKEAARIEVRSWENGGGQVVFCVRDNGAGFDMKHADKLFGLFQRLHTQDEFSGAGVGLAIVQRIVQIHGGRVWGEGKVGEGAAFYFTLPHAQPGGA